MGESRRRQQADPLYGKVSRALQDFAAMQQAMFLTKYQEIGRFAALIDIRRDCIPFLTLKALKSPGPENSLFRQVAGEALIAALSLYNPQQEAILLHLWDKVSEVQGEITLNVQLRQLSFGHLSLDPSRLPPRPQLEADDSLAIAQTVLLATSVPMGPVLSIESFPTEQGQGASIAVPVRRQAS